MVGPEAMEKFCEDIGVEPENVSHSLSLSLFMTWAWIYQTTSFSSLLLERVHSFLFTSTEFFFFTCAFPLFLADYHVSYSLASRSSKYGILHKRRVAQGNDVITVRKL